MSIIDKIQFHKPQGLGMQLLKYAFPSVIGMLIVGMQTIIDGIFVSKGVGTLGLAAINLSMPLINIMLSISIMIISGGVVIAGIAQGRGDKQLVKGYTSLTFAILLTTMVALSLIVWLFLDKVCYLLGADLEVFPYVRSYLSIIGCAFIFYCIPNFTEAFTRLSGRPNWVFISGSICFVVNVVLDYFFVLKFGWGVKGAAIATCAANTSAAIVLAPLVPMGKIKGGWKEIKRIFYNGSSEMLTSVSSAITTFVFNIVLMKTIGPAGVAALTIVCYLNFIVNMSIFGLSQALYPLMSYQLGARNYMGIRTLLIFSMAFSACIGIGVYLLVLIFKVPIINAFAADDFQLKYVATTATTVVTLHYLCSYVNIIGSSFHTALARPLESAIIALCRSIVFALLPLFILTPIIGNMGIWLSMPLAEVLTLAVSLPLIKRTLKALKIKLSR